MIFIPTPRPPTPKELDQAKADFVDYIKVVVDIESERYTLGGRLHADGEKILLAAGSKQANLWGGGVALLVGETDANALINTRPNNASQEILDPKIRERFFSLVRRYFPPHARQ